MSGGSIQHWRSHRLTEVSEESGDARSRKEVRLTPFFNSVGPGRWSGQSGKELVLAAPFLHPEMERQAMEVGRSVSGGFSDTAQQRGSKFRAQSSG